MKTFRTTTILILTLLMSVSMYSQDLKNNSTLAKPIDVYDNVSYYKLVNDEWVLNNKNFYYYDEENGKCIEKIGNSFKGDSITSISKTIYKYDENGNFSEEISQSYKNNEFHDTGRILYYYDSNNNLIEKVKQGMGETDFKNNERTLWVYNDKNEITESTFETWNSIWRNNTKIFYKYDGNSKCIEELSQKANSQFLYENDELKKYNYDNYGNDFQLWNYRWLDSAWSLSLFFKNENKYENGNLVENVVWSGSNENELTLSQKTEYAYSNNLLQKYIFYVWYSDEWHETNRNEYTYNNDNLLLESIYIQASSKSKNVFEYKKVMDVENSNLDIDEFAIYPNPVNNILTIRFDDMIYNEIRILSITGATVFYIKDNDNFQSGQSIKIEINNLPAGFYYLDVVGTQKRVQKSFIKIN